jgi:tRNA-dihydrouridine synthase C
MIHLDTPALVLAPMDGVTDFLMRGLLTARMPFTYCVTEFIRVSGLVPPKHVFLKEVPELLTASRTESGAPVGVQLLGGDPDRLAQSALVAVGLGAQVIDLNFGCPAPTVNRHDGGATLLKFPERIEAIVSAVRSAVPVHIPVSAKLRLGWDDPTAIYENAARAARGGASWITIHGRTKFQGYTPPAYWEPIGEVRRSLSIPVVANGEIWSVDDLKRCQEQSGAIHFMLGRGALANPTLAQGCAEYLGLEVLEAQQLARLTRWEMWRGCLEELVTRSRTAAESDRRTLSRVKQWLNYAHHRGAISWFDRVKRVKDTHELQLVLSALELTVEEETNSKARLAA